MSYLHRVRLAFAGTFQADVSTVNNDVRNYRRPHPASPPHGLQNPTGSGAFRLIDCKVTGVGYEDGSWTDKDPVVGMRIAGAAGRTSAKLVDLDPQWQMASTPWGLEVRLTDGEEPAFFAGRYQPHAFRDLWLTRTVGQRN